MRYCLNANQSAEYLSKADEIKILFKDREIIPDLAERYPNADLLLVIAADDFVEIDDLNRINILSKGKLKICLQDINKLEFFKESDIRTFWGYQVTSPYQLQALEKMGVCGAYIGAPVFFNCEALKQF